MKTTIYLAAFISGMVLMIFEMAGARIIGPHFGTSMYVWSSIIGVIMASLSIGYWFGGKQADKESSIKLFSLKFYYAAISLLLVLLLKDYILSYIAFYISDIKLAALVSGVLLFGLPSFFFGTISPYAIKLLLNDVDNVGKTSGNLYAISTLGSIVGTFLGGFFLVPTFGINNVLIICIVLMIVAGLLLNVQIIKKAGLIVTIAIGFTYYQNLSANPNVKSYISEYSNIRVYEAKETATKRIVKHLMIDNHLGSSMYLDSDELVYDYLKYYKLDKHLYPNFSKVLMLGGAACSYPNYLIQRNRKVEIDVVEIDKKLIDIAFNEFQLVKDDRLKFYYEDARTFLNRNTEKYNIIYGDAFNSLFSIPFQLTTIEAIQKMYHSLDDNGAAIVNLISSTEKDKNHFLRAEYTTYKEVFPFVYLFKVRSPESHYNVSNYCIVASKKAIELHSEDTEINDFLSTIVTSELEKLPVLTDNKAPVEKYVNMMN